MRTKISTTSPTPFCPTLSFASSAYCESASLSLTGSPFSTPGLTKLTNIKPTKMAAKVVPA